MKRKLYARKNSCGANCLYCFAQWGNYNQPSWESEQNFTCSEEVVIYPCCDGDFFQQSIGLDELYNKCGHKKNYISISTKQDLSDEQIEMLTEINDKLIYENKGFIKIGIPFTSKSRIDEIEKGTAPYDVRKKLLSRLMEKGLNVCVVIKPLLPFISVEEYIELINDLKFVKKFLIGDLYVDINSSFYQNYIDKSLFVQKRLVKWLDGNVTWDVIEQTEKKAAITDYINNIKCEAYESDIEVIRSFM